MYSIESTTYTKLVGVCADLKVRRWDLYIVPDRLCEVLFLAIEIYTVCVHLTSVSLTNLEVGTVTDMCLGYSH